jgi:hypothetical protein
MNKIRQLTRGIINCRESSLQNFSTFNQTMVTVDNRARCKSATNHTANRWQP